MELPLRAISPSALLLTGFTQRRTYIRRLFVQAVSIVPILVQDAARILSAKQCLKQHKLLPLEY